MVTTEQLRQTLIDCVKNDLAPLVREYLTEKGYIDENNMVNIDKICSDIEVDDKKEGGINIYVPIIGDISYTVDDIEALRKYVNEK